MREGLLQLKKANTLDLIFVVDDSGSISEEDFLLAKQTTDQIIQHFSNQDALFAVVFFSSDSRIIAPLGPAQEVLPKLTGISKNISNCSKETTDFFILLVLLPFLCVTDVEYEAGTQQQGQTCTGQGLRDAAKIFRHSGIANAKKVVFLITDGAENCDKKDALQASMELKSGLVSNRIQYSISIRH